jgi:hypothetical protein
MSFQMNNDNDRGFWWGDDAHTNAQGAMSLSTNGKLSVATAIRVGHGESDTALAGSSYGADFAGTGIFYGGLRANAGFGVNTAAGPTGTIRATSDITAFYSSDARLKEKIERIDNAVNKLSRIRGVTFNWTDEYIKQNGGEDGYFVRNPDVGVIAQELLEVLPEAVAERPDGMLAVKYDRIVALLIEAIKEQQLTIKQHEARINKLESE